MLVLPVMLVHRSPTLSIAQRLLAFCLGSLNQRTLLVERHVAKQLGVSSMPTDLNRLYNRCFP